MSNTSIFITTDYFTEIMKIYQGSLPKTLVSFFHPSIPQYLKNISLLPH